jgi:hypothetical protein
MKNEIENSAAEIGISTRPIGQREKNNPYIFLDKIAEVVRDAVRRSKQTAYLKPFDEALQRVSGSAAAIARHMGLKADSRAAKTVVDELDTRITERKEAKLMLDGAKEEVVERRAAVAEHLPGLTNVRFMGAVLVLGIATLVAYEAAAALLSLGLEALIALHLESMGFEPDVAVTMSSAKSMAGWLSLGVVLPFPLAVLYVEGRLHWCFKVLACCFEASFAFGFFCVRADGALTPANIGIAAFEAAVVAAHGVAVAIVAADLARRADLRDHAFIARDKLTSAEVTKNEVAHDLSVKETALRRQVALVGAREDAEDRRREFRELGEDTAHLEHLIGLFEAAARAEDGLPALGDGKKKNGGDDEND